jgi:hypothetical protein
MTPLFPARRSAERFDSLVEGGRRDGVDPATADLLGLVGALRSVPEAQPRPEFVADLREQLMLAAATELKPVQTGERDDVARLTIKPVRTRRERRVAVALATVAVIGATTSMAVASQNAIPGDALYPLKRAIENTETGFSRGDDAKGQANLGNASTRLDEVGKLTHEKNPDATLVTQTLNTFAQQFVDGSNALLADYESTGDQGSIKQIHANAEDSIGTLASLDGVIPTSAHDALVNAAGAVLAVDAQARNACPACGTGVLEAPPQLVAGASEALGGLTGAQAGGELPGTSPSGSSQPQLNGGKASNNPSGLNPPETPIQLPPPATASSDPLGGLLPTPGAGGQGTTGGTSSGTNGGTNGGSSGGNGNGGKGGKGHHPVDLTPVTQPVGEAVNQVVNGVVQGVTGLLSGLTGGGSGQ